MAAEVEPQPDFVVLERARHSLIEMPDGTGILYRAGPLCERCDTCGCGDQADPVPLPEAVVSMLKGQATDMRQMAKALMRLVAGNGRG